MNKIFSRFFSAPSKIFRFVHHIYLQVILLCRTAADQKKKKVVFFTLFYTFLFFNLSIDVNHQRFMVARRFCRDNRKKRRFIYRKVTVPLTLAM